MREVLNQLGKILRMVIAPPPRGFLSSAEREEQKDISSKKEVPLYSYFFFAIISPGIDCADEGAHIYCNNSKA
jgi:hypothetical protein